MNQFYQIRVISQASCLNLRLSAGFPHAALLCKPESQPNPQEHLYPKNTLSSSCTKYSVRTSVLHHYFHTFSLRELETE